MIFKIGIKPVDRTHTSRIREWTLAAFGGADGKASVSVNEIICNDPSCPGTETVILVMRAGRKTEAAKVSKPAAEIIEAEVLAALQKISA